MFPKLVVSAIFLALSMSLHAQSESTEKPSPAVKPAQKRMLPPRPASGGSEDLLGRTVYQALLGDFALRQGDLELASSAWGDLAMRTRDPQALARAIEVLGFARKHDLAMELAELWVQIEPESVKARQVRSGLMVSANRLEELAPQISALLAQDVNALPANLMQLNRLLSRHTDKKAVQTLVDRVAFPYVSLPEAHFAMSQAASNAGDEARALAEIGKALQLRPEWEPAALIRARLQAPTSPQTSIQGLQAFVRAYPEARDARLTLARLLIAEKRYDESREHFDLLVKVAPDSPEIIYPLAMLALQQGDAQRGRAQLEHLLETDFPDKSTIHFFIGQIDEDQKRFDAALARYQQVVSGDQYMPARSRAAVILQKQGKLEAAREIIRTSRTSNEAEKVQVLLAESQLLRDAGRSDEAYKLLESSLKKLPENTELLYEVALLAERQGKPEVLEKHLKRLLEIKPDHPHGLNALGYSYAERNIRLAEAEKLIARALQITPDDPYILDSRGWVYFRQGRLAESIAVLERAYGLKRDGEIAAHLGEVLWVMGRKDEAKRILLEARTEHPENEVLGAIIRKLLP